MPWGPYSILQTDPRQSNDGPILWIRAGEQLVPTAELSSKTPLKRQRYIGNISFIYLFLILFCSNLERVLMN